jgi:SAM-dependent methyltransferase
MGSLPVDRSPGRGYPAGIVYSAESTPKLSGSNGFLRLVPDPGPEPLVLAARELLRAPAVPRPGRRELEPFTRGWFEELELKRYTRAGMWLPRVLEFTRHPDEQLLMLGPGLGTDALQFLRHGTKVVLATLPDDHPDLIRRNFEFRGLVPELVTVTDPTRMPFGRSQFDVIILNALTNGPESLSETAAELYRVLKPGGKLIGLFPTKYDPNFWSGVLHPLGRLIWGKPPADEDAVKRSARQLKRAFGSFAELVIRRRHLRRSELPPMLRVLPPAWLERWLGRVLTVRGFKPLSAAWDVRAAA